MASFKEKEMIFGLMEVVFGLATVFALNGTGFRTDKWGIAFGGGLGCTGALIPLMMRFNMRYFNGSPLPKAVDMMVMIWAMVLYYAGGLIVVAIGVDSKENIFFLPGSLAVVAAIVSTIDFILGLCSK